MWVVMHCQHRISAVLPMRSLHVASQADILRGSSRVPAPRASADLSGRKPRPITADLQIWEVHFGP